VGYALVTLEEASPTWAEPAGWAEIDSLALLPEARGQGIGEQLLARVQAEAGGRELRLFALAGNAGALRFYEREGFETFIHVMRRPARD
jgi:ribosomal protein S18 acetylase RimI-like enzyme